MRHIIPIISLAAAVGLLVGSSVCAETVYRWKDANGQSHYSQQPPEGVKKFETISSSGDPILHDDAATPPASSAAKDGATPAAKAGPGGATPAQQQRTQLCKQARENVTTLTQHATVTTDLNGDGKPVTLNAAQHDKALSDANKQVDLYCNQ